ncbi:MAG: hypothetical protein QXF23_03740 [Candidatus Bathyarchaeia archaeon]
MRMRRQFFPSHLRGRFIVPKRPYLHIKPCHSMTRLRGKACGGHGEKPGLGSIVKPAYPRMGWLRPLIALVFCGAAVEIFH